MWNKNEAWKREQTTFSIINFLDWKQIPLLISPGFNEKVRKNFEKYVTFWLFNISYVFIHLVCGPIFYCESNLFQPFL